MKIIGAVSLRLRRGPLPRRWDEKARQCPTCRSDCSHGDKTAQSPCDGVGHKAAARTGTDKHGLVIAEVPAIGIVQERVRLVHNLCVDACHPERCEPSTEGAVILGQADAVLTGVRPVLPRAEQVRIEKRSADGWVFGCFLYGVHEACDCAAGDAAPHVADAHLNMRTVTAKPLKRMLLKKVNPKIGRNGIKTAAMNDARSTRLRARFVAIEHAPDPLRLSRKIAVIGSQFRADLDQ